jgi:phosphoglycolate phosphatase-like HAD superfamily hydrolase
MRAYIFDIDGTLANGEHRRHHIEKTPKDWDAYFALCHLDEPIPHIFELARDLDEAGVAIVYVTGRRDDTRQATEQWLWDHYAPVGDLFMRKAGDFRADDVIKIELLAEVRAQGYEPIMVFDDRTRVVNAFRAAGLPCAQVAPGDF